MPRVIIFALLIGFVGVGMIGAQAPPTIPNLPLNEVVVGTLGGGAETTWHLTAQRGQVITFSVAGYPPRPNDPFDPYLAIYNAGGELLFADDDSSVGNDAIIPYFPIPADGDYTVLVRNQQPWEDGSYELVAAESNLPTGCQTPFGSMVTDQMPSVINGYAVRYRVFMPPCAETYALRFPYVILGHGSNSSDEHWDQLGLDEALVRGVALNRISPMALVLPWGGELANTNVFREGASWEWVVVDELIPYMESTYCLMTNRKGRAIGGISRGGFWAFLIAFRHPHLFTSLGGHSPFFDLYHAPPTHNPLDLAMGTPPNPPLRIWMDRGQDDYAQLNIDRQHDRLTTNNIDHIFMLYTEGQHENAYWRAHLDEYLKFYSEGFYGDNALALETLPLCP